MSLTHYKRCHWETGGTVTKSITNHKIRCISTQRDDSLLLRLKFSNTNETLMFQGPEGSKQAQTRKYQWGLFCSHGHCDLLTSLKTLSAGAWGQACKEGTISVRQRPEMPVSLRLEEGRCHQSHECGQRMEERWNSLGQELRVSKSGHLRAKEIKPSLFREVGLHNLSPLWKQGHTRDISVLMYMGFCFNCLPLRRKKASQAPR